jgi:hypothetical protein
VRSGIARSTIVLCLVAASVLGTRPADAGDGIAYTKSRWKTIGPGVSAKTVAHCPDGFSVIGGGVEISDRNTATAVGVSGPMDDDDEGQKPDDGWVGYIASRSAGNKTFRTHAVCAAGKYTYVKKDLAMTTDGRWSESAECPDGSWVIGGGGVHSGTALPNVVIASMVPIDTGTDGDTLTDDAWTTTFDNRSGGTVSARVWAICDVLSDASYEYLAGFESISQGEQEDVAIYCTLGSKAISGAVKVTYNGSANSFEVASIFPLDSGDKNHDRDDGWFAAANGLVVVDNPATLTMTPYAICRL